MPILTPIFSHLNPPTIRPSDLSIRHIAGITDVVEQDKQPIRVSLELKLNPASLGARDPAVAHRDDASLVLGKLDKHSHGEVKVLLGWVTPMVDVGLVMVRRAKVCGGDLDGPGAFDAPLRVVDAHELETSTAGEAIVEESRA